MVTQINYHDMGKVIIKSIKSNPTFWICLITSVVLIISGFLV